MLLSLFHALLGVLLGVQKGVIICTDHDIPFKTVQMDFKDESHATYWIIKNQLSRRNIPPGTRIILAKKLEPWLIEQSRKKVSETTARSNRARANGNESSSIQMDKT